jgi:ABC-2 type transport system ATP-binding protein
LNRFQKSCSIRRVITEFRVAKLTKAVKNAWSNLVYGSVATLVHEPKLLILDEPTAGVDIELRRSMWTFLKQLNDSGTTIILTTHYLEEAEHLCRNIAIIDRGKIVENTSMKNLLKQLHAEVFILDLTQPIDAVPSDSEFSFCLKDSTTLEVSVLAGQSINALFQYLSGCSIVVSSMRGKANRLEELFVKMVQENV